MDIMKTKTFAESKIIASKMVARAGHLRLDNFKKWVLWLGEKENLSDDDMNHIIHYFVWDCGYTTANY